MSRVRSPSPAPFFSGAVGKPHRPQCPVRSPTPVFPNSQQLRANSHHRAILKGRSATLVLMSRVRSPSPAPFFSGAVGKPHRPQCPVRSPTPVFPNSQQLRANSHHRAILKGRSATLVLMSRVRSPSPAPFFSGAVGKPHRPQCPVRSPTPVFPNSQQLRANSHHRAILKGRSATLVLRSCTGSRWEVPSENHTLLSRLGGWSAFRLRSEE